MFTILPCSMKIVLFFSSSLQLRSHQIIDDCINIRYADDVENDDEIKTNYNAQYKKFAEERGMSSRLKRKTMPGETT